MGKQKTSVIWLSIGLCLAIGLAIIAICLFTFRENFFGVKPSVEREENANIKPNVTIVVIPSVKPTVKLNHSRPYWPLITAELGSKFILELDLSLKTPKSPKFKVSDTIVLKKDARRRDLTNDDLIQINDDLYRTPIDNRVYLTFPQAINLSHTVDSLMRHKPIEEAPINNRQLQFLSASKSVCHPDDPNTQNYDVVYIVKTYPDETERRHKIRRLYAGFSNANANANLTNGIRIGYVFFSGTYGKNPDILKEEIEKYDDFVVGDFDDNYHNRTLKDLYIFSWFSTYCRDKRPVGIFTLSCTSFIHEKIAEFITSKSKRQREEIMHGMMLQRSIAHRNHQRYQVSKSSVPWPIYPPYLDYTYQVMGFGNIERMALGMYFTQSIRITEAWVGLIALKLDIDLHDIKKTDPNFKFDQLC